MKITKAYIRHYSDNGQNKAYVEYADGTRTEGEALEADQPCPCCGQVMESNAGAFRLETHMAALFARARREGVPIETERW